MAGPSALPPLNSLRAFEAAGRHLTFRAAADELGVTQGAVAQQVRGLETRLGLRLFERGARGLRFTAAGRTYHAEVSRAFAVLGEATAQLRPSGEAAAVTVSVTPSFAAKWLLPNLPDFTAAHPGIDLAVLATESVSRFTDDGIALAVRLASPPFPASIEAHLLFDQDIIAVAAPERVPPGGLTALTGLPLLHDAHNLWPAFLAQVTGQARGAGETALHFNQTSLSIDAALAGQGVALASRFLVARDLAAGRLVQAVPGSLRDARGYYLLAPRQARRPEAVTKVMDWLRARAAAPVDTA